MTAKDLMTTEVITVGPAMTIKQLALTLIKNQISGAPVVDQRGKIVGIVSEADLVAKKGKDVRSIMNRKVISIVEETPVEEIAQLMSRHKIKRLPVMNGDKMVGIVSRADLVNAIAMGKHLSIPSPVYDL
jgi:CBS domain-containing protein